MFSSVDLAQYNSHINIYCYMYLAYRYCSADVEDHKFRHNIKLPWVCLTCTTNRIAINDTDKIMWRTKSLCNSIYLVQLKLTSIQSYKFDINQCNCFGYVHGYIYNIHHVYKLSRPGLTLWNASNVFILLTNDLSFASRLWEICYKLYTKMLPC